MNVGSCESVEPLRSSHIRVEVLIFQIFSTGFHQVITRNIRSRAEALGGQCCGAGVHMMTWDALGGRQQTYLILGSFSHKKQKTSVPGG